MVIVAIILLALFGMVYMTKRRFGVLGLGLAAGAILSSLWVGDLTPIISEAGIVLVKPPLESVVAAGIILLPAVLLLILGGPTYHAQWQRLTGAVIFSLLATALLLEPLGSALVVEGPGKPVYDFFDENQSALITAGLVLALFDVLMTRGHKSPKEHAKH